MLFQNNLPFVKLRMKFPRNLFWVYYAFLDSNEHTIDNLLENEDIPATILNKEFIKPGSNFIVSMLRCSKCYKEKLETKIFPALHNANLIHFGIDYLKEFEQLSQEE